MIKRDKQKHRYNSSNERMKYKYEKHLGGVCQKDATTINACLKHIREFDVYLDFKGYETFNDQVAHKYIQSLFKVNLSLSYVSDNIRCLKEFLRWLERQKGYRSKLDYNHIDYLNLSRNQLRTAKASDYKKSYKFDQMIRTIRHMDSITYKQKRDKALISLQALCALRVSELRTVKLKNLIEDDGKYFIYLTPRSMKVKFAKTREANFMSLPHDIINNVIEWRDFLLSLGFKDNDPLFPKIDNRFGQHNLLEQKIKKEGLKSGSTIRNVFKIAFTNAGNEYISPHSFRRTHALFAQKHGPDLLNAIRQNLGHNSIDTTLNSYGQLSSPEQRKIISSNTYI
jgi:integrase